MRNISKGSLSVSRAARYSPEVRSCNEKESQQCTHSRQHLSKPGWFSSKPYICSEWAEGGTPRIMAIGGTQLPAITTPLEPANRLEHFVVVSA